LPHVCDRSAVDPVVDAESGLIYLRARYYDPATGQFMSRDPLVVLTGEAYGYVGDNPLNEVDPLGLCVAGLFGNHCKHGLTLAGTLGGIAEATGVVAVVGVVAAAAVLAGPEILVVGGTYLLATDIATALIAGSVTAGYASAVASGLQTGDECFKGGIRSLNCESSALNTGISGAFTLGGLGADPYGLRGFGMNAGGFVAGQVPVTLDGNSNDCPSVGR
jgi:RHS repeat-associated protein